MRKYEKEYLQKIQKNLKNKKETYNEFNDIQISEKENNLLNNNKQENTSSLSNEVKKKIKINEIEISKKYNINKTFETFYSNGYIHLYNGCFNKKELK